jgi:hypothetical protein
MVSRQNIPLEQGAKDKAIDKKTCGKSNMEWRPMSISGIPGDLHSPLAASGFHWSHNSYCLIYGSGWQPSHCPISASDRLAGYESPLPNPPKGGRIVYIKIGFVTE